MTELCVGLLDRPYKFFEIPQATVEGRTVRHGKEWYGHMPYSCFWCSPDGRDTIFCWAGTMSDLPGSNFIISSGCGTNYLMF
jgi:hypothetical protein